MATKRDIDSYLKLRSRIDAWKHADRTAPVIVRLSTGGLLELRNDVPKTRGECPTTRPCPHVRCRHHLALIEADARPGRRWSEDDNRAPTLRAFWLESPLPSSCALDVAERVRELPVEEGSRIRALAREAGIRQSRWREIVQTAIGKLAKLGAGDPEALLEALGSRGRS